MGTFLYHPDKTPEQLEQERTIRFLQLPFEQKLEELYALNAALRALNGGKPLKEPQAKGIVLRRKKAS